MKMKIEMERNGLRLEAISLFSLPFLRLIRLTFSIIGMNSSELRTAHIWKSVAIVLLQEEGNVSMRL